MFGIWPPLHRSVKLEWSQNVIDYFQVLVQVFQQVMLSKEHPYLKNFYMIIPALCINYVDTIRVSKDKMDKVKRQGARQTAYFTDDGFAIGIA